MQDWIQALIQDWIQGGIANWTQDWIRQQITTLTQTQSIKHARTPFAL